jgi:hypothetical protein
MECFKATHGTKVRASHILTPLSEKKTFDCLTHKQPLILYCHDDDTLVCLMCGHYGDHKDHSLELISDAAPKVRIIVGMMFNS